MIYLEKVPRTLFFFVSIFVATRILTKQVPSCCVVALQLNVHVLIVFFNYVLCVAFLMKFRWGNAGAMEGVNVVSQQVSAIEGNNNSRGTVFMVFNVPKMIIIRPFFA